MILFFYEKTNPRSKEKKKPTLTMRCADAEQKKTWSRKNPEARFFFQFKTKNSMRLEELQAHLQKRTHKDLFFGYNKSLAEGPNDEEMDMAKMKEVQHQWQFNDTGPSDKDYEVQIDPSLDPNDLQDFGEHAFNEISLNAILNPEPKTKSVEIKKEPIPEPPKPSPVIPILMKPEPKPAPPKLPQVNRSYQAQNFLLNPSKWEHYETLFAAVNERLKTQYRNTMGCNAFDAALRYIYVEAMKAFDPDFFVTTKREDSSFREIAENCLQAYKKELDDLLNRLAISVKEPFAKFIEAITDDHIFAISPPYLETRTPKEYFCFVTGEKIPRGSRAFVLVLHKNAGQLISQAPCYIKWHTNPRCPTLFVDMAMSLASFLTLCCILLGKIVHYPGQDKSESPEMTFRRFLGDTKELADLIVFQYEVITAARSCYDLVRS